MKIKKAKNKAEARAEIKAKIMAIRIQLSVAERMLKAGERDNVFLFIGEAKDLSEELQAYARFNY